MSLNIRPLMDNPEVKGIILDHLRKNGEATIVSAAWDLFALIHLASCEVGVHLLELEKEDLVDLVDGKFRIKEPASK